MINARPYFPVLAAMLWLTSGHAQSQAIAWRDLLPSVAAGVAGSDAVDVNSALIGREVELKGYLLPVDREGDRVYAFLLVPIAGACSHMPAPPPNQMAYVAVPKPYVARAIYEPVAVRGVLREESQKTQLFILDGVKVVETAYSIGQASVTQAPDMPPPAGLGNPLLSRRNHTKDPGKAGQ